MPVLVIIVKSPKIMQRHCSEQFYLCNAIYYSNLNWLDEKPENIKHIKIVDLFVCLEHHILKCIKPH